MTTLNIGTLIDLAEVLGPVTQFVIAAAGMIIMALTGAVIWLSKRNKEGVEKLERIIEDNLLVINGLKESHSQYIAVVTAESRLVTERISDVNSTVDRGVDAVRDKLEAAAGRVSDKLNSGLDKVSTTLQTQQQLNKEVIDRLDKMKSDQSSSTDG